MVYINEWLPNPTGPDGANEFIELYNGGSAPVNLNGWSLKTEKGKIFSIKNGLVAARGYLVLKHADTKLTLRNSDGGLMLYDARGALVDSASFVAAAPDGKSFSRVNYLTEDVEHFAFVAPTPGAANKTGGSTIASQHYPTGVSLTRPLTSINFLFLATGTAITLIGLILYAIRSHEALSKLFLQRNGAPRRGDGQTAHGPAP